MNESDTNLRRGTTTREWKNEAEKIKAQTGTTRESEMEKNLNEGTIMRRRRNAEREKK